MSSSSPTTPKPLGTTKLFICIGGALVGSLIVLGILHALANNFSHSKLFLIGLLGAVLIIIDAFRKSSNNAMALVGMALAVFGFGLIGLSWATALLLWVVYIGLGLLFAAVLVYAALKLTDSLSD